MYDYFHIPVLLAEVVSYLQPAAGKNFIDATLGGGGYSREILRLIGKEGMLLSVDLDQDAVESAARLKAPGNWIVAHGNFGDIDRIAAKYDFPAPHGIVADLGLSSHELDYSGRGMSFKKKELLDMRFDQSSNGENAAWVLNNKPEKELERIFREYGEERFSRQIARQVVTHRLKIKQIRDSAELYGLIKQSLPKPVRHKSDDSARRIFQALRIEVNRELDNLKNFLPKAFDLLVSGGRMGIVSFHSLEDRLVKQFFVSLTKGCVCPADFPLCVCGKNPQAKIVTRKPVTASPEELALNPRSGSAKLRVVQKI